LLNDSVFREKTKSDKTARILSYALLFIASFFIAAAVYVWFTGSHDWKILGIEISLRHWRKPWWYGIGFLVIALLVARDTLWPFNSIGKAIYRLGGLTGVQIESTGKRWALMGVFVGSFAGTMFALHYYWMVPRLAYQLLTVVGAAIAGMALHGLFGMGHKRLTALILPSLSEWRSASFRIVLYVLLWSWLVTGPLSEVWHARGTENVFLHSIFALFIALTLSWLLLAKWTGGETVARVHKAATLVVLIASVVVSVLSWVGENSRISAESPRDRVLLITVDTTRADFLSCYGYPRETSPNLDRIAASGARFTRAFCPMGITDPSHATILSGLYPRTHGLIDNFQSVAENVTSLAEVFRDKGYMTAAVVSRQHVLPSSLGLPGFDSESGPTVWMVKTSAQEAFRRAANLIIKHRDQKLFMWIHFFDPHKSYVPHKGYTDQFVEEFKGPKWGEHFLKPGKRYSQESLEYRRGLYAGEIRYMDHWIGRLVDFAGTLAPGPERPPFVLVIADHGEGMGEYQDRPERFGFGHGGLLLNGVIHIPLIMSWPGEISEGLVVDDVAESIDVAPTILDYVLDYKDYPTQGQSLRRAIQRQPTDNEAVIQRAIIKHVEHRPDLALPQYAIVREGHKLIVTDGKPELLYDLEKDWEEENNLLNEKKSMTSNLEEGLQNWKETTPMITTERADLTPSEIKALKALGYLE